MANNRKFDKNRSVSSSWENIPSYYTGIRRNGKELVIMEFFGKHLSAAWRSDKTNKIGIRFLLKLEDKNNKPGFILKGKWYKYGSRVW